MNQQTKFWNANPCGGEWVDFEQKTEWLLQREPHIKELIRDDLFSNREVLDVGTGQGVILSLIAKKAKKAVGIDVSEESLKRARSGIKLSNVEFKKMDAEQLLFENSSFDTVLSHGVLHHTENTQKGIDEIRRVLKDNGKAVVMLYRKWCPKGIAVVTLRALSRLVDMVKREESYIIKRLKKNSSQGTALFELFGCSILKTYSKRQIKNMFSDFNNVNIYFRAPGFLRITDFMFKNSKIVKGLFRRLDKVNYLGFYIIIEAEK